MFSFRILFCSVDRCKPRRSAAPPLPDIFPDAAFRASTIACRSTSLNVESGGAVRTSDRLTSGLGTFNSSPAVTITQRLVPAIDRRWWLGILALHAHESSTAGTDFQRARTIAQSLRDPSAAALQGRRPNTGTSMVVSAFGRGSPATYSFERRTHSPCEESCRAPKATKSGEEPHRPGA
jgi:hypothetical protein